MCKLLILLSDSFYYSTNFNPLAKYFEILQKSTDALAAECNVTAVLKPHGSYISF
jgi:hypothetical protein